jgi:propionyl-CoA carboxylase alpha chain
VRTIRDGDAVVVEDGAAARRVVTSWQPGQTLLQATMDGVSRTYQIAREGIGMRLSRAGWSLALMVLSPRAAELLSVMPAKVPSDHSHLVLSPMPGLLVSIAVSVGQDVKQGQEIAVIEAMKMENMLRAERDGTVAKIYARAGDSLAADQIILEFA